MFADAKSKQLFSTTFQTLFQKLMIGMKIANTRFEKELSYGQTVKRVKFNLDSVAVRDYTDNTDLIFDNPTDTSELLTINKYKTMAGRLSDLTIIQAGPLKPEAYIAGELAKKISIAVDADVLAEVKSAYASFDSGDLTGGASNGTPITITTANFPQFVSFAKSKLRLNNINVDGNVCFVVDPQIHAVGEQYLMGKNNDLSVGTFANGYAGSYNGAEVYVSNNLTADVTLTWATNPTAAQTVTVAGKVFTFVAAIGATEGNVLIGATRDLTAVNLVAAIAAITARKNAPTVTPAGSGVSFVEFTSANLLALQNANLTATDVAATDITTITGVGAGRTLTSATNVTGATVLSVLNGFVGKRGAVDLVVQMDKDMQTWRDEARLGIKYAFGRVYGLKTFSDGAQQMLNVKFVL